jgi:hypothetical protein
MWAMMVAAALCVLAASGTEAKAQRAYRVSAYYPSYRYGYSPYSSRRYYGGFDYPQYNNGRLPYSYGYSPGYRYYPAASYYSSPSSADGSSISSSSSISSGVFDGRGWGSAGYLRR